MIFIYWLHGGGGVVTVPRGDRAADVLDEIRPLQDEIRFPKTTARLKTIVYIVLEVLDQSLFKSVAIVMPVYSLSLFLIPLHTLVLP